VFFEGIDLESIKAEWEESNSGARRLSAVDKSRFLSKDMNHSAVFNDAKTLVQGLFEDVVDLTSNGLEHLTELKMNYTAFSKDAVINKIAGYVPDFGAWGHDAYGEGAQLMETLKNVDTFDEAVQALEDAAALYCVEDEYIPTEKVPSKCVGPKVRLEFVPKKCVIAEDGNHEVECKPAQLVLMKKPGKCTMKHYKPAEYKGKECKVEKKWGKDNSTTWGGDIYMAGHISTAVSDHLESLSVQ
jgi:hypothetical protein